MEECLSNRQVVPEMHKQGEEKDKSTVDEGKESESLFSLKMTVNEIQTTSENDTRKPLAERVRPKLIDDLEVFYRLFCYEIGK